MPVRAEEPVILVLGDSLSAAYGLSMEDSWVSLLQQRLHRQGYPHRLVNASMSGETTRGGLDRLDATLRAHSPVIVIIELGANDGLRGLLLEEMDANLRRIIDASRAHGVRPLLVRMRLPPNYGPVYVERFAAVYERIGEETRVPLTSFMLEGLAGNPQFILDDGVHPNAAAQERILENLWPAIETLLDESRTAQSVSR